MSGLTFPTPFHRVVFVMVTATLIYLAIGVVFWVVSTIRIWRVPGIQEKLAGESRATLAWLLLAALKANLFHWPIIYLHIDPRKP